MHPASLNAYRASALPWEQQGNWALWPLHPAELCFHAECGCRYRGHPALACPAVPVMACVLPARSLAHLAGS